MAISRKQAREYVSRWEAVRQIEARELRALTPAERHRHLVDLFTAARRFPEHPAVRATREREIEQVRARWNKIKGGF